MKLNTRVALVTGAADRIGAALVRDLHQHGYRVLIHYRSKREQAEALASELNQQRPNSVVTIQADLADAKAVSQLTETAAQTFGSLSLLINNASVFAPDPAEPLATEFWDHTLDTNVRAPWLLARALAPELKRQQGSIINLIDIYADHPLARHSAYNSSKAGLAMLTKSLALELAPDIRVNGIAPGAILWPEPAPSLEKQQSILGKIPLGRIGSPAAIVEAARFLLSCDYITGQIIKIDGGRSLAI